MKRMGAWCMGVLLAAALPAAWAGLEPVLGTCADTGASCLWQEPAVSAPTGWVRKQAASGRYRASAFAPAGSNFENANAVMYAKAVPKAGQPATLAAFIAQDIASFRRAYPGMGVQTGLAFNDGDGRALPAVRLTPGKDGKAQWETIAYGEEGDSYLVFALSANGVVEQEAALPAFAQLVASYHAGAGGKR
jgi:hypothetical protein